MCKVGNGWHVASQLTTSGSSGLGSSVSELKKNASGAEFGKGLPITDDQMTWTPELVKEIGF
ncbi:hypothetical protein N692_12640 [Lactiplantibacillus plantarum EGD-AQ4]|nr:hypothetical protein N692_12640 [Lactiplantibacillus plantarum EGD-AQ4]